VKLQTRILLGLVAGIVVGTIAKLPGMLIVQRVVIAVEPLGTAFIRLITMVVIPLVVGSLFVGIASLGDVRRLGRVGGRTLTYFVLTTVIAATIGVTVAQMAGVGQGLDAATRDALASGLPAQGPLPGDAAKPPGIVTMLLEMIPQNPFASAARGDLLPLIIAVCIFAAAATVVDGEGKRVVLRFFQGINDLSMVVIRWLMWLAPPAVFVLIAATVARSGVQLLAALLTFALVAVAAMAIHVALVLMPALRFGARMSISQFTRATGDALMMAFSTASSNVTLPVSMAAARNRLGLPNEVVSFVLPAGATLNKNGAAVYKAVTAIFLARLYGVPLDGSQLVTVVATSTLAAFAGTGVPGSSLVTTLIVLNAIGLGPFAAAGIALVTAIDRPLDMCRTTVNTIGNLVGTAWVARREGVVAAPEASAAALSSTGD
jgi:Na+/H+-dicarboxylate symporter